MAVPAAPARLAELRDGVPYPTAKAPMRGMRRRRADLVPTGALVSRRSSPSRARRAHDCAGACEGVMLEALAGKKKG